MLNEIEKIINKCSGEQRSELVGFYKSIVENTIQEDLPLDKKKILLVFDLLKYLPSSEKQCLISKIINIKIFQLRTYILNAFDDDFSIEKSHFSKISKWTLSVIDEIKNTLYDENSKPLDMKTVKQFHEKFCDEIKLIFCSNEKFNSSGNQLLIDMLKYFDTFEESKNFKDDVLERIRRNFNSGKIFSKEKIDELFHKIESSCSK